MKELNNAIKLDGYGIGNDIVKVDMFLNHRIDTELMMKMGEEFKNHFSSKPVDIILTIETSGIAIAMATAYALGGKPVVFAKKHPESSLANIVSKDDSFFSPVYSYTHSKQNIITIKKDYLPEGSNILIVDDFLANGEATNGLIDIIKQANCHLQGIGICVEKGFQPGGKNLRAAGYDLLSLAIIDSIENGNLNIR